MPIKPNSQAYLQSISLELLSQRDRIRQLIGARHWPTDGVYKENLLRNLLRRHLPSSVLVTKGFLVLPDREDCISKEQDILILDVRNERPLFMDDDVAISHPDRCFACISVKSTFSKATVQNCVTGLASAAALYYRTAQQTDMLTAAFVFEDDPSILNEPSRLTEYIEEAEDCWVHARTTTGETRTVCVPDLIAGIDRVLWQVNPDTEGRSFEANLYDCEDLASAIFLAWIVDHVTFLLSAKRGYLPELASLPNLKLLHQSAISPPT